MISYISVLGVHQTASKSEIKAAYRELALEYHPDRKGIRKLNMFLKLYCKKSLKEARKQEPERKNFSKYNKHMKS